MAEPLRLGYACINTELQAQKILVGRGCIARTYRQRGQQYVDALAKSNLEALQWNEEHGIRLYRMTSNLLPHITNEEFLPSGSELAYDPRAYSEYFTRIGELAKKWNHRLTFHPSQYNQLASPSPEVVRRTERDLTMHATLLDLCGLDFNSVLVVHGGGVYNDKAKTLDRWEAEFHRLPEIVKRRLVIENCERAYNVRDMLTLSQRISRPVVYDLHHDACYRRLNPTFSELTPEELDRVVLTWTRLGLRPKFHISESAQNKRLGAHSDYIEYLHDWLFTVKGGLDLMVEAKMKEQAVLRLYEKYF